MTRKRATIGGILITVLVLLLLCGIVAGEFPELLTLTDNTSNDFTIRSTNSVDSRVLRDVQKHDQTAEIHHNTPAPHLFFSRLSPFEEAASVPRDLFIRHSVLRT
jgi:hypothetical protein